MMLFCAGCGANYPREAFMVTVPEKTLTTDRRPVMYARHTRCGFRTIMPRSAMIGRDKTKVR